MVVPINIPTSNIEELQVLHIMEYMFMEYMLMKYIALKFSFSVLSLSGFDVRAIPAYKMNWEVPALLFSWRDLNYVCQNSPVDLCEPRDF